MRIVHITKKSLSSTTASYRGYSPTRDYQIEMLADWFTDDVGNNAISWKEWFNDQSEAAETTESNATWLEKDWLDDGSCIVTFGSTTQLFLLPKGQLHVPKDDEILLIPKDTVLELLDTWEQLIKKFPPTIAISEENGVYKTFEIDLPDDIEYEGVMRFPVK